MYDKFIIKTQAILSWSKSIGAYGKVLLISKPLKHLPFNSSSLFVFINPENFEAILTDFLRSLGLLKDSFYFAQ